MVLVARPEPKRHFRRKKSAPTRLTPRIRFGRRIFRECPRRSLTTGVFISWATSARDRICRRAWPASMPRRDKNLWEKLYLDFLSDTIYTRYSTSSPTIDPETGNVYMQDTQGIFAGFTPDGKTSVGTFADRGVWPPDLSQRAAPAFTEVDGDLVMTRGITANWGANGPAADRFYAFDKTTGQAVWASTPGSPAKGQFVFLPRPRRGWMASASFTRRRETARSSASMRGRGRPIFRIPVFKAGINSSVLAPR